MEPSNKGLALSKPPKAELWLLSPYSLCSRSR